MRLSRLPHPLAWLCLAALLLLASPSPTRGEPFSTDNNEILPGVTLPSGVTLPFEEAELLNNEAKARLERYAGSIDARAKTLLTQGLVGQAIHALVEESENLGNAGREDSDLKLALAACYQQAGRFADALALINSLPETERAKQADYLTALEDATKTVAESAKAFAEDLKENPTDAYTWAEISRFWLLPNLQVRRNALAAASLAVACNPDYEPAREALAEALAAYAFTEWSLRQTATAWERGYRQGASRPPKDVYDQLVARIDELAPKLSMVAKLKDLYLIAPQPPGIQREGAQLERDQGTVANDPRYDGYLTALNLLASGDSTEKWEQYKALETNRSTYHYFAPLKLAARQVQLSLYTLCKPKLGNQKEAIKSIPEIPLPQPGDYVFWEGWRWLARGIAVSRDAMNLLPPEAVKDALLHLEKAQQNHETDGALLGAIGEAWFTAYLVYSKPEYKELQREFLLRSVSALDAAAAAGIDVDAGAVRAAALRAAREYDRAQKAIVTLGDPGLPPNPTAQDKERVAVQWLKLGFLYLDYRPTADSARIAGNCIERAASLLEGSPSQVLLKACRAIAASDRGNIIAMPSSPLPTLFPPFGAEVYARLCEMDTKLAYLELVRLAPLGTSAISHGSFVTDPLFYSQVPLQVLALQVEDLVASQEGFPIVTWYQDVVKERTRKAFSSPTDFERETSDPKAVSKRAGLTGIEARALESTLTESREALFATVNALHRAMASGAAKKQFNANHSNATVSGVLHATFCLKEPEGVDRPLKPMIQVQPSWEDFVFSLTVGYVKWATAQRRLDTFVLGLESLDKQIRDVASLKPDREQELYAATKQFNVVMKAVLQAERDRIAREDAARAAERQRIAAEQAREAAEEARRQEEWRKNPVIAGLDFSVTEPTRAPVYTYQQEEQKAPERITCDVCGGRGVTTTQTDWSNSARQTCWRCKGKGWRSPHDM